MTNESYAYGKELSVPLDWESVRPWAHPSAPSSGIAHRPSMSWGGGGHDYGYAFPGQGFHPQGSGDPTGGNINFMPAGLPYHNFALHNQQPYQYQQQQYGQYSGVDGTGGVPFLSSQQQPGRQL